MTQLENERIAMPPAGFSPEVAGGVATRHYLLGKRGLP